MSMRLEFEPHSWYMGAAIQKKNVHRNDITDYPWTAYIENGNFYVIDEIYAATLTELKERIRAYHLRHHNGYGERIAKREATV